MRWLAVSAALLGAVLGLAAPASARIVVGESIAGVKLLDSKSAVRSKLGRPTDVHKRTESSPERWYYSDDRLRLQIEFNKHGVHELGTSSSSQRTAKGIGPGSRFSAVARAYPDACADPFHCLITTRRKAFTRFSAHKARRTRVQVVSIEDLRYAPDEPPPPS